MAGLWKSSTPSRPAQAACAPPLAAPSSCLPSGVLLVFSKRGFLEAARAPVPIITHQINTGKKVHGRPHPHSPYQKPGKGSGPQWTGRKPSSSGDRKSVV